MVKAEFGPGTYFIGDICYALDDTEYYEIWGKQNNYEDGVYDGFAVGGTAYGDGCYLGTDGKDYGVDAGVIGVVEKSHWDEDKINRLDDLGRVIEVKDVLTFECEGGEFTFDWDGHTLSINTGYDEEEEEYEEEEEEYEEDDIYEQLNTINNKLNRILHESL